MSVYKLIMIGPTKVGKSEIFNRFTGKKFNAAHSATIVGDFCLLKDDSDRVQLWDSTGELSGFSHVFYRDATVGIYCIDLSNPAEQQDAIALFRGFNPGKKIILVGTKMDLLGDTVDEQNNAAQEILEKVPGKFAERIAISAKNDTQIEDLKALLIKTALAPIDSFDAVLDSLPGESALHATFTYLQKQAKSLSSKQYECIATFSNELAKKLLEDNGASQKAEAIKQFTEKCALYLEGKHPKVMKAALGVAAAASVTLLVTALGFALGILTIPSTIVIGLIATETTTLAISTAIGIYTGGLTFFRGAGSRDAVGKIAVEANEFDPNHYKATF
ncbi:P-loop NTPase family protein [Legionella hackeliae]|nr:hypothetical protein [Legionella hackeliae]